MNLLSEEKNRVRIFFFFFVLSFFLRYKIIRLARKYTLKRNVITCTDVYTCKEEEIERSSSDARQSFLKVEPFISKHA